MAVAGQPFTRAIVARNRQSEVLGFSCVFAKRLRHKGAPKRSRQTRQRLRNESAEAPSR